MKKAQEEMIGFALIIILVSMIILTLLFFTLRGSQKEIVESYEVESFLQSALQYTSNCKSEDNLEFYTLQKLIFECNARTNCLNSKSSCEVLEETFKEVLEESWMVGEDNKYKGYLLNITLNDEEFQIIKEGNLTGNNKGGSQFFSKVGSSYEIYFSVYY